MSHAQKMEMLGHLVEGITHEFNNLMTVVSINAELLRNRIGPQESDPLARICGASDQAASLSRRLRGLVRPVESVRTVVDLNEEVRGLEPLARSLLGGRVELELVLCPDLARIEADRSEIAQLVMSLVGDAKKAVSKARRIVLETFNAAVRERDPSHTGLLAPGSYVGLRVSDTGVGAAAGMHSRVFEPFHGAGAGEGGTGLGLAMVRSVATRSGGGVRVSSAPGRGTCFEVLLPAVAPRGPGAISGTPTEPECGDARPQ